MDYRDNPENPVPPLQGGEFYFAPFGENYSGDDNKTQRDYILLALFTGLRRREAATLRWDDVDLKDRMIRLPAERTKGRRKLDLPMSDFVADLLTARRAIGQDGPYVFPANSRSGHIEEPRFALDEVKKMSGIKVRMHDLRRTFITVAEECEMSVYALKALVNHSLGRDVTAGYIQFGPERLREPMQRVTDRLRELIGINGPEGANVRKLKR
jgi:integrase